ncbi:MAG: rhodanese-like domain-containing protein [Candidatus Woesearchaeota archaeon]
MVFFQWHKGKKQEYREITAKELKERLIAKENFVLLDVRTPEEFKEFHILGSILIPYNDIEKRHTELRVGKDKEIVVICRSGNRSAIACKTLYALGYRNIANVKDGILGWN